MSEKVVWQLLQPYAKAAGVPGIAPHDLRRYAESRIMPNRQRCDHAGKAWDTARCGIFLAMPVLRVGRDDPIRLNCAVPRTIEHVSRNLGRQPPLTVWAERCKRRPTVRRCALQLSAESSDLRTMPHHSRGQPRSAAHSTALRTKRRLRIRHNPAFGIATTVMRRDAGHAGGRRVWLEDLPHYLLGHSLSLGLVRAVLQHVSNPAYNQQRGPVWIPSIRLHVELGKNTFGQRDKH
jgi:hypothetical protein